MPDKKTSSMKRKRFKSTITHAYSDDKKLNEAFIKIWCDLRKTKSIIKNSFDVDIDILPNADYEDDLRSFDGNIFRHWLHTHPTSEKNGYADIIQAFSEKLLKTFNTRDEQDNFEFLLIGDDDTNFGILDEINAYDKTIQGIDNKDIMALKLFLRDKPKIIEFLQRNLEVIFRVAKDYELYCDRMAQLSIKTWRAKRQAIHNCFIDNKGKQCMMLPPTKDELRKKKMPLHQYIKELKKILFRDRHVDNYTCDKISPINKYKMKSL